MIRIRLPLWARLAAAMGLVAVIPVLAVSVSSMDVATRIAEESSATSLRREASDRADDVSRWLQGQAQALITWPRQFGETLGTMSYDAQSSFPRMVYTGLPAAVAVVLVDGTGRPVVAPAFVTTGEGGRIPSDDARAAALVGRLPLEDAVRDPTRVHVGSAWIIPEEEGPARVPLAVLAAGGDDAASVRVLGVELAVVPILESYDERAVALLDARGAVLAGGGRPELEPDRLRPLLDAKDPVDFRLQGSSGEIRGSLAPVPESPRWWIVVAEPSSVIQLTSVGIRERIGELLVMSGAAALLLALIVAGSLSRPIERLRSAALRVADGELGVSAHVERGDEIGELGSAFDHMSSTLAANRDEIAEQQKEIEAFARELQQRVEQRTQELRNAQEDLVRAGQLAAVAEIGAGLAHEINNPLAAVLGIAQVLSVRHPDDPLLADLAREAARCRDVVETLLRITARELEHEQARIVELPDLLRHVHDLVGGSFRQRGIGLRTGAVAGRVRVDPVSTSNILAQVLNALRAGIEPGATVSIEAEPSGSRVALRIVADRPVAAEPDRRDDWMVSSLGLWVASQLLERLGGRLERRPDGYTVLLPGA
jgi:signal transduction histidine kinase